MNKYAVLFICNSISVFYLMFSSFLMYNLSGASHTENKFLIWGSFSIIIALIIMPFYYKMSALISIGGFLICFPFFKLLLIENAQYFNIGITVLNIVFIGGFISMLLTLGSKSHSWSSGITIPLYNKSFLVLISLALLYLWFYLCQ